MDLQFVTSQHPTIIGHLRGEAEAAKGESLTTYLFTGGDVINQLSHDSLTNYLICYGLVSRTNDHFLHTNATTTAYHFYHYHYHHHLLP